MTTPDLLTSEPIPITVEQGEALIAQEHFRFVGRPNPSYDLYYSGITGQLLGKHSNTGDSTAPTHYYLTTPVVSKAVAAGEFEKWEQALTNLKDVRERCTPVATGTSGPMFAHTLAAELISIIDRGLVQ